MLYIFLVNDGKMMTFDMNLALDTVDNLKSVIWEQHRIPVSNQVLLISGGESLNLNDRVCKYSSAGTDTSPIFLFSKANSSQVDPRLLQPDTNIEDDMKERVESCLQMEPSANTVAARVAMASKLFESDQMLFHSCDKLVHDQHLQQQGWAAVVANLEDVVLSFRNKYKKVEQLFSDVLNNKSAYYELLQSFEQDKQLLSRIPILKSLHSKSGIADADDITLLEWISRKDTSNSLDELFCLDELNQFDQEKLLGLKSDVEEAIKASTSSEMKEIKGLESRLFSLDKLMLDAQKVFERQNILTKGFSQNQNRFTDVRDASILPDLCQNHKEQLEDMLANHLRLIDYKKRCWLAKQELSLNLSARVRWIVHVEEKLKQTDDYLVAHGLKLMKLREKLEIMMSVHLAPQVYLNSIVEVMRRRAFSDAFFDWARKVSQIAKETIDAEIEHRRSFAAQLDKHFIKFFFPGMNDYPENFITDLVPIDQSLPQVSSQDFVHLKDQLPDLSSHLVLPSSVPIPLAALVGDSNVSANQTSAEPSTEKREVCHVATAVHVDYEDSSIETLLSWKDICQLESAKSDMESCLSEKNQLIEDLVNKLNLAEAKCQEKDDMILNCSNLNAKVLGLMKSMKSNVFGEINDQISNCSQNFNECLKQVNTNLEQLNDQMQEERRNFEHQIEEKSKCVIQLEEKNVALQNELDVKNADCDKLNEARTNEKAIILSQVCEIEKLKETIEKLHNEQTKKHTTIDNLNEKLKNLKSKLEQSKREITILFNNFVQVEMKIFADQFQANINTMKQENKASLKSIESKLAAEKENQVQKMREQLSLEHKNELDSLRHRFKLAISTTSIERTTSETSLEKVQLDIVDQSAQENEIQKMKSSILEQKAEHEQTMAKVKAEYESIIHNIRTTSIEHSEMDKEKINLGDNLRKFFNDTELSPDQVLHRLKMFETLFTRLNSRLNIDLDSSDPTKCKELLGTLLQDVSETSRNLDMFSCTRSFISIPATPESPKQINEIDSIATKYKLKNLELVTPNNDDKISVTSCEFGDNVLVYYERQLENFIVFSLTSNLHYIHGDSLKECDFSKEIPPNEFQWIIAKVMEKEYCQIKKEENRYKLPVNTKFYRVKIRQISKCNTSPLKVEQANPMNRSYTPSTSNRTILSNIMSFFGTSFDTAPNMSQSCNFEKN